MKKLYLLFLVFIPVESVFANNLDSLRINLLEQGYENVIIAEEEESLIVSYENRVYRFEMEAIFDVLKLIFTSIKRIEDKSKNKIIKIITQNRGVPIVKITVTTDDLKLFFSGKIRGEQFSEKLSITFDIDKEWAQIKKLEKENKNTFKFDFAVYPIFETELDEFNDAFKFKFSLAPAVETTLGTGSFLRLQYIIPVWFHRDFLIEKPVDRFRPGLMNINQTIRFPKDYFFSLSVGFFTEVQYGIDAEFRKFLFNGIASLGANLGFTGQALYQNKKYEFSPLENSTYFFDAVVRIPSYNLSLSGSYGKYIYEDKGYRFDIKREFSEFSIGFFVEKSKGTFTSELTSGGFYISVPLPPYKYSKPGILRLRPSQSFDWGYNAIQFNGFSQKRYRTGNSIDNLLKKLYPDNINRYFNKMNSAQQ